MQTNHIVQKNQEYLLGLHVGDKIHESLVKFCKEKNIISASYTGIGAITKVHIGSYDPDKKGYTEKKLEGNYELTSLVGNISRIANDSDSDNLFAHSHITFTREDYTVLGGHLMEAEVLAVTEIFIQSYNTVLERKHDPLTRLNIFQ